MECCTLRVFLLVACLYAVTAFDCKCSVVLWSLQNCTGTTQNDNEKHNKQSCFQSQGFGWALANGCGSISGWLSVTCSGTVTGTVSANGQCINMGSQSVAWNCSEDHHDRWIAAIVVPGGLLIIYCIAGIIYYCTRRRRNNKFVGYPPRSPGVAAVPLQGPMYGGPVYAPPSPGASTIMLDEVPPLGFGPLPPHGPPISALPQYAPYPAAYAPQYAPQLAPQFAQPYGGGVYGYPAMQQPYTYAV